MDFKFDYDLDNLELITPKDRDFQLWITPRFKNHFLESSYERFTSNLIANFVKSTELFLDVGAHYGYYSVLAGKSNPDCKVIAYEPVEENFTILKQNLEHNQINNIESFNNAVSNQEGKAQFFISAASDNCGFIKHPSAPVLREEEIATKTINSHIDEYPDSSILIKLDVEGHELEVLESIQDELKGRDDITLIVEYNPKCLKSAGHKPELLINKLNALNYDIFFIDDDLGRYYKVTDYQSEIIKTFDIKKYVNLFCIKKSRSLNVIGFSHSSALAGAERSLLELVKGLIEKNQTIITVYLTREGPLVEELNKVGAATIIGSYDWWCAEQFPKDIPIETKLGNSFSWLVGQIRELEKINPDLIVTNTLVIPWGAIAAALINRPHVWKVHEFGQKDHGFKFYLPFTQIKQYIVDASNKVIANSKAVHNELFHSYDADNIDTIYYQMDIPDETLREDGIEYYRHKDSTRLVIMGTIVESKGQEDAVLAAIDLIKNRDQNVELVVVGYSNSNYMIQLKQLVKKAHLEDSIYFLPFQENVIPIIDQADIVLVCSRNEAFGRVTIEGMLMGKAVIGTDAGGTIELIEDGKTGLLYNPGDNKQLADQIECLIKEPKTRKSIAKKGYLFAKSNFIDNNFIDHHNQLFSNLKRVDNPKNTEIQDLINRFFTAELIDKNSTIIELGNKITNSDQTRQELSTQLAEKEKIVQGLKVELAEKEKNVQGLKVKLTEKEQMVQDLKLKLAEKEQIVQDLQVNLDEKEQIVQDLKVELADKEEVERNLQSQLLDNEDRLEALTVRDAKKERTIQEMETQLAEYISEKNVLQGQIKETKNQLNNNEKTLGQINAKLLEIYDSTAWKLVRIMWRIRLFLAPQGSLRETMGRKIINGFRRQRTVITRKADKEDDLDDKRGPSFQSEDIEDGYQKVYETLFLTAENERDEDYVDYCQNDIKIDELPVKTLAFYLPQFHPIPENDLWWGKGFTEWTNVSKAKPQFVDHYQPHLPGELGYYDLRIPDVQRRQAELAKNYGIFGFCYYYYWFNGKRLLEHPLDQFLNNEKNDFPFCLCWANENWTRRWDGMENEILIAQTHSIDNDLQFIKDIAPYTRDNRYIHIDGRPLILVYRANILNNPKETSERWREYANSQGLGNPFLVAAQVFGYREDPEEIGFDAAVEFPPNTLHATDISRNFDILNTKFNGRIYDYGEISNLMSENQTTDYKLFKTVMPSWDNTPRKPDNSSIFVNASPRIYEDWLVSAIRYTQKRHPQSERFVFINAWNEWAEGTHLEPDRKYGYAYLQATTTALQRTKKQKNNWKILFISHDTHMGGAQLSLLSIMYWLREHTGVELKILCLDGGQLLPEFINAGDTLLYSDIAHLSEEARIDRLVEFCDGNPDLIYANSAGSGKIFSWLHKIGIPILTHFRELDTSIKRYAADWIEDIWDYSQGYIANSEAVRQNLVENYSIDKDICHTAHTFVQLSDIEPYNNYKKQQARQELGLEKDKTIIFGCGIGMPFRKGADLFIDTAQKLLDFDEREFHLYWIGDFNENEKDDRFGVWSDFLQNLEKQKLDEYVTFLGQKSDPRKYMRSGDIFVLTSREEAIGRVIFEAADCGLPVICFDDSGGAPEFVEDDAGFIVSKDDTRAMAGKISFLMQNEDIRNKMGSRAREKALSEFSEARIMPKVLSISRKVAGKSPLVSIIMTNYNHAPYLPQRLESIFNQTYQDFEVFLMDDSSTDNSVQILKKYSNRPNVHLVVNEKNDGSPFDLWLKAFSLAEGEIIWIAESDDLSEKDFLEKMLPAFNDPQVQLAYCASNIINKKGEIIGDYKNSEYLKSISKSRWDQSYCIPTYKEINEAFGIKNTILNMSSVLFRKINWDKKFERTLSNFNSAGDTYLLLNLMKDGKIYYDSRLLNYHRRLDTSIVGKILLERGDVQLNEFWKDYSINKQYIVHNFQLSTKFLEKLDNYLIELWATLAPGSPYEDLKQYFPLDDIREQVRKNIQEEV